jgi:hypothetical protein
MSNAQDYRTKSAEFARLAREASSLKDIKEFRRRAHAFTTLAENEEWVAANRDKIISNRAPADGRLGQGIGEDRSGPRNEAVGALSAEACPGLDRDAIV